MQSWKRVVAGEDSDLLEYNITSVPRLRNCLAGPRLVARSYVLWAERYVPHELLWMVSIAIARNLIPGTCKRKHVI